MLNFDKVKQDAEKEQIKEMSIVLELIEHIKRLNMSYVFLVDFVFHSEYQSIQYSSVLLKHATFFKDYIEIRKGG